MASINLSLERALQGDGWWYSVNDRRWSRMWDDEMQYGQIRDGKFERIYPEPHIRPAVKADEPINHEQEAKLRIGHKEVRTVHFRQLPLNAEIIDRDGEMVTYTMPDPTMADVGDGHPNGSEADVMWCEDPKFTVPVEFRKEGEPVVLADLRDQFAMHAMQGILAKNSAWDAPNLALKAYEFADAMMIAREMKRVS